MIQRKGRIVLYYPNMANPALGIHAGRDLLPLSLLTIAAWPDHDGYEVILIDGNLYSEEEAQRRVLEACSGALLFATSAILGYQVYDGARCAQAVRAKHPDLPVIAGGWFPSCAPEYYLENGAFDAVGIGQGEITFRELVMAIDAGEPLDSVAGLALWRDGGVVFTDKRAVVGWSELLNCPWHLLDIEPYREAQLVHPSERTVERLPVPPDHQGKPFFGISYYGSFGCPEHCIFCCSPEVTGLRWKAMPGERMLDDLCELKERWDFDVVRFYDANWGVNEKRVLAFCDGLIERDVHFWWYPLMQAHSIMTYDPGTLDKMRDAGMYVVNIGGETGDEELMRAIGKHADTGENLRAAIEMEKRGILPWMTYIIGYPEEQAPSMMSTIDQVREIASTCTMTRPTVWPYRPIPGSALYPKALELGYQPPSTLEAWGRIGEYHLDETWPGKIPPEVERARRLFEHFSTLKFGLARERHGWWERRAARRMETGNFRGAAVEAKAFDIYFRVAKYLGLETPRVGRG